MRSTSLKPLAIVFIIVAAGAGGAGLWLQRQRQPTHEATALVHVVRDATDLVDLGGLAPQGTETAVFLQNQSEIIRSPAVLIQVLKQFSATPDAAPLRDRIQIESLPADGLLRIKATGESAADAISLANSTAEAFCRYRTERRFNIARDQIAAVETPFREKEAMVKSAQALLEQARGRLAPEWQSAPPNKDAEDQNLKTLRSELNRVTMSYVAQTNRLALSQNLPPANREALQQELTATGIKFTNALSAVTASAQRQEALRAYWLAAVDVEKAEKVFAPIASLVATNRSILADTNSVPAQITEVATQANNCPPANRIVAQSCLIAAGVFLAAALLIFIQPRKTTIAAS